MIRRLLEAIGCTALLLTVLEAIVAAHSGPPYPIVSNRALGAYSVSIWTDPDTTDDGKPAGQFWIELEPADGRTAIPAGTQATVAIRPLDREGPAREGRADPVRGKVARQFVALLMDHEGPFALHATLSSSRGSVSIDTTVDATYDLRPARWLLGLYIMPFLAVGFLWMKLILVRRRARQ